MKNMPDTCYATTIVGRDAIDSGQRLRCERHTGHAGSHKATYGGRVRFWPNAHADLSAASADKVRRDVGQSHDFCECGTRHDFDVPPGTEKTYACECGRVMCHRTVPNEKVEAPK